MNKIFATISVNHTYWRPTTTIPSTQEDFSRNVQGFNFAGLLLVSLCTVISWIDHKTYRLCIRFGFWAYFVRFCTTADSIPFMNITPFRCLHGFTEIQTMSDMQKALRYQRHSATERLVLLGRVYGGNGTACQSIAIRNPSLSYTTFSRLLRTHQFVWPRR